MTGDQRPFVAELRREAIRARDEHGNTDFYALLRTAAETIESYERQLASLAGALGSAAKTLKATCCDYELLSEELLDRIRGLDWENKR